MIPFISRHLPTAAQAATVAERFGELVCPDPIVFEAGRVSYDVGAAIGTPGYNPSYDDDCTGRLVAGVFPGWALLELLRAGWTVVEFVNEPSARSRGVFVCRGAFVHTIDTSEFIACPVPAAEQEDGPLLSGLRPSLTER